MKSLFSFITGAKGLRRRVNGKVSISDYVTKHSEYLIEENRAHKEFQELSKEIQVELANAKGIITEEKQKTAILICYKNIFSILYH